MRRSSMQFCFTCKGFAGFLGLFSNHILQSNAQFDLKHPFFTAFISLMEINSASFIRKQKTQGSAAFSSLVYRLANFISSSIFGAIPISASPQFMIAELL